MKTATWSWGAVVADAGIFLSPLPSDSSAAAYIGLWALHTGACAVLATSALLAMPAQTRSTRMWTWLLLLCFALAAPVLGPLCMVLIVQTALRRALGEHHLAKPRSVALPEYEVRAHQAGRAGQAAIRSRLTPQVPAPARMRSLLTLQVVPNRVANPILEGLLSDDSDDVRLVAFGMLDAAEKKLSGHIHQEQQKLETALSLRARYDCLRQLGELHWELVYAGLASGGLKLHNLNQARKYVEAALAMDEQHEAGVVFLHGRILMAQGDAAAQSRLQHALALGQAPASVLPYLADLAFEQRDFATVRAHMRSLTAQRQTAKTTAIVNFWTGRDSVQHYRDRPLPEHL